MMNKEKINMLAKLYVVNIAIASVAFLVRVYVDVPFISAISDFLTECGIVNVSSILIVGLHGVLYTTGGSDLMLTILVALHILMVAGAFLSMVMILSKKKFAYMRLSLVILTADVLCHALVGGIIFPAVIGLVLKVTGIYILLKAYKLHKNEQKENTDELT